MNYISKFKKINMKVKSMLKKQKPHLKMMGLLHMLTISRLAVRARDCHLHRCASAFTLRNNQFAATHQLKPLPDIIEGNVRLVIINRTEAGTVVLYYDLYCFFGLSGNDRDVYRIIT